jgi:hypothetical protein
MDNINARYLNILCILLITLMLHQIPQPRFKILINYFEISNPLKSKSVFSIFLFFKMKTGNHSEILINEKNCYKIIQIDMKFWCKNISNLEIFTNI